MNVHRLKTHPHLFKKILNGDKNWEYRIDDRGFEIMDELHLDEWDPSIGGTDDDRYTGRRIEVLVTDIYYPIDGGRAGSTNVIPGLPEGYVIMCIKFLHATKDIHADQIMSIPQTWVYSEL